MRTLIIAGTRPEIIKCVPVYLEAKKQGLDILFCNTGQHKEMTEQAFKIFNTCPDLDLNIMTQNQTLNQISGMLYSTLPPVFEKYKPDYIMVQGDTTTAMISTLIAFNMKCKVIHLEAGLRTGDKFEPYPEEVNRRLISVIGDIHLCPTQLNADNLSKEGISDNVYIYGNTIVDAVNLIRENHSLTLPVHINQKLGNKQYILVTAHRRESFGTGIANICEALLELSMIYPEIDFVYPVHPNPNIKNVVLEKLSDITNIVLLEPVDYIEILSLMQNALMCISDSGGIQEEAPSFNKYTIVLRNFSERMESVHKGYSFLVGTDKAKIVNKTVQILDKLSSGTDKFDNPYGDGYSSRRIVDLLKTLSKSTKK